ncbi:MAG: hypothetical protein JXR77_11935 [Lentisphaeria bacterium]|nr:hypothetical protein [Lentisphaeria bacterium]
MKAATLAFCLLLVSTGLAAADRVLKRSLSQAAAAGEERITNGGLEEHAEGAARGWRPWERGYSLDAEVRHDGRRSARCRNDSPEEHRGLTYEVRLDQTEAVPILATCWSRAEGVSGGSNGDYSLYLDLEYMDGTPLWGQIAPFRPGTHDWQKRTVLVVPEKPVRTVLVHGIFRRRSGTAWFDGFGLRELSGPGEAHTFDAVPVNTLAQAAEIRLQELPALGLGLFLRDVAAGSDFLQPESFVEAPIPAGRRWSATLAALELEITADMTRAGDGIRLDGEIRDLSGRERAVTVYCTHAVPAQGWDWHDDQRTRRRIEGNGAFQRWTAIGAGANGMASLYPLACVSGPERALALAAPLDVPRLWRFAYAPASAEFVAAVDLGLSPAVRASPGRASFAVMLYPCDPAWGFRSALERYYSLLPQCFTKRNRGEGIWMPFTDIATVKGFEDFGFQFQEGAPNVAFDEQHGIDSFVYVEPMSLWVPMPAGMERSDARARAHVRERAAAGDPAMRAALASAIVTEEGEWSGGIVKAPWCDGALYLLNPSPHAAAGGTADSVTQFEHEWGTIRRAVERAGQQRTAWRPWDAGYEIVPGAGRNGSSAARLTRAGDGPGQGATQTVVLGQTEPRPLTARAWTRAEKVSGTPSSNYSLYIDLVYADGTPGWGFVAAARTGTHDWQLLEQRLEPAQAVRSLSFHLLFRAPCAGTVWFDDASLVQEGDETNRIRQDGFEPGDNGAAPPPRLDGTYIDSFEMAAAERNYRAEHFAGAEIPLVFDREGRVCQLGIFNTLEFTREVARRMWAEDRMMFANSTPHRFPWGAAWLDIMGTETNWAPGGAYTPNPDAVMNYRRALCCRRPYLLLLNTVFDTFEPAWVERYFSRCLAYGIFPGFFSHNAADDPYWTRPALYERDRPLFRRFLPVIRALSAAGWEPVTHARSDNPKVYLERFGSPGGPLYLTAFNDSDEAQTSRIHIDAAALGLATTPGGNGAEAPLTLAPEEVRVLTLAGAVLRVDAQRQ